MSQGYNYFKPRIIIGMSGEFNARIDCSNKIVGDIRIRMDMPPSCIDIVQEQGRTRLFKNAREEGCFYNTYISL